MFTEDVNKTFIVYLCSKKNGKLLVLNLKQFLPSVEKTIQTQQLKEDYQDQKFQHLLQILLQISTQIFMYDIMCCHSRLTI